MTKATDYKSLEEYSEDWKTYEKWRVGKTTKQRAYELERLKSRWRTIIARNKIAERKIKVHRKKKHLTVSVQIAFDLVKTNRGGRVVYPQEAEILDADFALKEDMDDNEICDAVIEKWVNETFGSESPVEGIKINAYTVAPQGTITIGNLPMAGITKLYNSFQEVSTHDGQCVIDYLLWEAKKPDSRKLQWTRPYLQARLGAVTPTTNDVIRFAKEEEDVAVYALDMMMKVVLKYTPEKARVCLFFMINNGHLYPVIDRHQRLQIREVDEIRLNEILITRWNVENAVYVTEDFHYELKKTGDPLVLDTDNLEVICANVMEETGTAVEKMTWDSHRKMTAFEHPLTKRIVISGADWMAKKSLCDEYFEKTRIEDFVFRNQGFPSIARSILTNLFADIPKSEYSSQLKTILEEHPIRPYRMKSGDVDDECVSIDINKCYTSILLGMDTDYPIFGAFDCERPLKDGILVEDLPAGEYYLHKTIYIGRGTIKVSRGFKPLCFIKYLVGRGHITMKDVTRGIYSSRSIPADVLKGFVEYVIKEHPSLMKELNNHLVGLFGSLYNRKCRTGVSDNHDTVIATAFAIADRKTKVDIHPVGHLYIVRELEETIKNSGDVPINRAILSMAIAKLDQMVDDLNLKDIVGYNTDSVKVRKTNINDAKLRSGIGGYRIEPNCHLSGMPMSLLPEYPEWKPSKKPIEKLEEGKDLFENILVEKGGLVQGMAGCGKTTLLKNLLSKCGKAVVLTFTNAAAENLKARGVESHTMDSFLGGTAGKLNPSKLKDHEHVLIDEYTMMPVSHMAMLVRAQEAFRIKVICFGDYRQCGSIDEYVEFHTNRIFLNMCGNVIVNLKYKENYARYDAEMYKELLEFDRTGKLGARWMKPELPLTYQNLCYSNKKREAVNKECLDRWVLEHNSELINVGGMNICVGLPVTVYYENDKTVGFFKTQDWIVDAVSKGKVHLSRLHEKRWIETKEFREMFDYAFCKTTHKAQGITIHGEYVIWEAERMNKNVLNTALSRGSCLENVYVAGKITKTFYPYCGNSKTLLPMEKLAVKFKIGRIYRMKFANGLTYIGKTERELSERLEEHKAHPTNSRIKELFKSGMAAGIELLNEFKYVTDKTFGDVEIEYIEKEKEDRGDILNFQHNVAVVDSARKDVELRTNKKFPVRDEEKFKRFEVTCSAKNVDVGDKRVKFSYAKRDKEAVRLEAEAHSVAMKRKYY